MNNIDPTQPLVIEAPVLPIEKQGESRHPNANETSFKPGQSGNPNGRPKKGHSITERVKELLNSDPERKDRIINKILDAAEAGDLNAAKITWNYMDGMPLQATDITTLGNQIATPHVFVGPKPKDEL